MKLIDKDTLVGEINRLQEATMDKNQNFLSSYHEGIFDGLSMLENFLDTLEVKEVKEEPVSKDLEDAVKKYLTSLRKSHFEGYDIERAFKKGAQWQKERIKLNL